MVGLGKEYNKQKPIVGRFWPYFFVDMFGSEKPYGKVSSLLNHPIKLIPTQVYMFMDDVGGLSNSRHTLEMNTTSKKLQ